MENGGTEFFVSSLGFSHVRDNRLAVWSVTNTSSLHSDQPSLQIQQTLVFNANLWHAQSCATKVRA